MRSLDFLSLNNDLIPYPGDRPRRGFFAHLYDSLHPAVLRLVAHIVRTANRAGVPVTICGEMAGDIVFTRLLLGFGLRTFSMHPAQLLTVKREVLRCNLPDIIPLAQKILKADDPERIQGLLTKLNG